MIWLFRKSPSYWQRSDFIARIGHGWRKRKTVQKNRVNMFSSSANLEKQTRKHYLRAREIDIGLMTWNSEAARGLLSKYMIMEDLRQKMRRVYWTPRARRTMHIGSGELLNRCPVAGFFPNIQITLAFFVVPRFSRRISKRGWILKETAVCTGENPSTDGLNFERGASQIARDRAKVRFLCAVGAGNP